jgi:replication fork protection complex subunit Tof1/Swi1
LLIESDEEATDTPMSSPHDRSSHAKRRKVLSDDEAARPEPAAGEKNVTSSGMALNDEEDEDDVVPLARSARQRVRSGFIVDSSDEE